MIWPIYNLALASLNTVFCVHDVSMGWPVVAWFNGVVAIGCALSSAFEINRVRQAREARL